MEGDRSLRIANPYVVQDDLVETTGAQAVDEFLFSLVNVLQISSGEFLRAIVLIGSYAHGGYAPDSDIDLCLVWKAESTPEHWRRGFSLMEHLNRGRGYVLDPMWNQPETPLYDPAATAFEFAVGSHQVKVDCGPLLKFAMRDDSLLLWGEDVRPRMQPPTSKEPILRDALSAPLCWIRNKHYGSLNAQICLPLRDPAPEKEDRGYGDLKDVAIFVLHIARALVFLKTGEFLFDKRGVPDAFEQHCANAWAPIVRGIQEARQGQLLEPERGKAYHAACQGLTSFQNHFLGVLADRGVNVSTIHA